MRARFKSAALIADQAQLAAAERLDALAARLVDYEPQKNGGGFLSRLFDKKADAPKGLYLWGPVGRGKSMLMDMFFARVAVRQKRRVHFHEFMAAAHRRLFELRRASSESGGPKSDALDRLADEIVAQHWLICFDEFQVFDIADAMVLGRLFTALFARGAVVVATSNTEPARLYEGGLQRQLFLPFIDLLQQRVETVAVAGPMDHRQGRLMGRRVWWNPADGTAERALARYFGELSDGAPSGSVALSVAGGRELVVKRAAGRVAWFQAEELLDRPLGAQDFLAIAERFDAVLVSGLKPLRAAQRNEVRRLILLVDALYEAGTVLIASADADPDGLVAEGPHAVEFQRTASRLAEMQADSWLAARWALASNDTSL
ncbi:cell division protein ZapE [Roseiterribacter gracilis]|uniref:cell division protein ZapE n=1 Tax=Roseiterribacter gracilis TaxID=2812848 RepID=UPI003B43922C